MKTFRKIMTAAALALTVACATLPAACCRNSITDLRRRAATQEEQEPLDPDFSYRGEDASALA